MQICDEPSQFTEGERPRPQGSSPVEEYPEAEKYTDSDQEVQSTNIQQRYKNKTDKVPGTNKVKTVNEEPVYTHFHDQNLQLKYENYQRNTVSLVETNRLLLTSHLL